MALPQARKSLRNRRRRYARTNLRINLNISFITCLRYKSFINEHRVNACVCHLRHHGFPSDSLLRVTPSEHVRLNVRFEFQQTEGAQEESCAT